MQVLAKYHNKPILANGHSHHEYIVPHSHSRLALNKYMKRWTMEPNRKLG